MNLQWTKNVWCLKLLIILKFFVDKSNSVSLNDLRKICCVDRGLQEITTLPPDNICTAIAFYASNVYTTLADINMLKGKLPVVFVNDDLVFEDLRKKIEPEAVRHYVAEMTLIITTYKIDAFIIDNMYSNEEGDQDSNLQRDLQFFISTMKEKNPTVLFGMTLPTHTKLIPNAFRRPLLDPLLDFYLAYTYDYNECKHKNHQKQMAHNSPIGSMQSTLTEIQNYGYELKKVIYIVRLVVTSVEDFLNELEFESYSFHCTSKPGSQRKYCIDPLEDFYEKGKLLIANGMPGVFIQSVDGDDYNNACGCGTYPVLKVLNAGLQGLTKPDTSCKTFGVLPRDRSDGGGKGASGSE